MNHRWRGGGLAAAFLIVVGALVLGPWTVTPASAEKTMLGSISHALGANGYVKAADGNRYSFSSDSEGIYHYPGSIPDTSTGYRILTLYFTNPYSAQIAHQVMTDGTGRLVFTRPADTGATAPVTAPTAAPVQGTTANASITPGNSLQRLANLLTELEQNIKYASQQSDWGTARTEWVAQLTTYPSPAEVTKALQELELSLKASALAEDWNTRRVGWYTSLRQATTPAQFAELMKQLETAITWAATEDSWRERRNGWIADVSAAATGSSNATPAASATPAPAVNRADTSAIARLAELLTSFENSVKPESIVSQWATERGPWISALQRAASVADLKTALQSFEVSIRRAAMVESWDAQRTAWYTALRAATTPAHVAVQLRQLEGAFKSDAMKPFYLMAQGFWRVHVDEVANGTYSAPAAVPAPASPAVQPAPAASQPAAIRTIQRLAELVLVLEQNLEPESMNSYWPINRLPWAANLNRAGSVADLKGAIQEFELSLKPGTRTISWMTTSDAWHTALRAATTPAQIVEQLGELQKSIRWQAMKPDWSSLRESGWYGDMSVALSWSAAAAATPAPAAAGNLPKLAALLLELERMTMYQAQLDTWRDHRDAWVTATGAVTTIAGFREALLGYDASLKPEALFMSLSSTTAAPARRVAWRAEVRAASTASQLALLLKEFERALITSEAALLTSSVTADWPGRRAAWEAEVAAAGRGAPAPSVPSTPAPTTPVATAVPTIADLATRLINLESKIAYAAQVAEWKDRQRDAWIGDVYGATTMEELGDVLLTLESGIRPGSFKSEWSARRAPWRSEVQRTTSTATMNALTFELEQALLDSSWLADDDWY